LQTDKLISRVLSQTKRLGSIIYLALPSRIRSSSPPIMPYERRTISWLSSTWPTWPYNPQGLPQCMSPYKAWALTSRFQLFRKC